MAYNPGVNNNSGQILAGGLNDMMGQYAQDLLRSQEIEQKRRTAAGHIQGLLASDPTLGQKADPTLLSKMTSGKANYKDTLELLGTLSTVKKQEEEQLQEKLKQVQIQGLTQALQQSQFAHQNTLRNQAAMGISTGIPEIDMAMPAYDENLSRADNAVARGLNDPHLLAQLRQSDDAEERAQLRRETNDRLARPPTLNTLQAPGDESTVNVITDANGNSHVLPDTKAVKPTAQPFQVGGRAMTAVGAHVFDDKTGELVQGAKQLDPMAAHMLYTRYQATITKIQNSSQGTWESKEEYRKRVAALQQQANFQAKQLNYAEPFPAGQAAPSAKPAAARFKIVEQK